MNIFRHIVAELIIKQLQSTINKFIVAVSCFPSRFLIFRRGLNYFLHYYCFLNYYLYICNTVTLSQYSNLKILALLNACRSESLHKFSKAFLFNINLYAN